jgi:hypothetical protein
VAWEGGIWGGSAEEIGAAWTRGLVWFMRPPGDGSRCGVATVHVLGFEGFDDPLGAAFETDRAGFVPH